MASEGIDRSIVATMRRSSGSAETTRSARSSRARRATVAKGPATGRSERATIVKSKTFQPSRKKRWTRGAWASRRTAISPTKTT